MNIESEQQIEIPYALNHTDIYATFMVWLVKVCLSGKWIWNLFKCWKLQSFSFSN